MRDQSQWWRASSTACAHPAGLASSSWIRMLVATLALLHARLGGATSETGRYRSRSAGRRGANTHDARGVCRDVEDPGLLMNCWDRKARIRRLVCGSAHRLHCMHSNPEIQCCVSGFQGVWETKSNTVKFFCVLRGERDERMTLEQKSSSLGTTDLAFFYAVGLSRSSWLESQQLDTTITQNHVVRRATPAHL
jgi:hypothetical protein